MIFPAEGTENYFRERGIRNTYMQRALHGCRPSSSRSRARDLLGHCRLADRKSLASPTPDLDGIPASERIADSPSAAHSWAIAAPTDICIGIMFTLALCMTHSESPTITAIRKAVQTKMPVFAR